MIFLIFRSFNPANDQLYIIFQISHIHAIIPMRYGFIEY